MQLAIKILLKNIAFFPFQQGEIFIVPYMLWHRASVSAVLSLEPPHLDAL